MSSTPYEIWKYASLSDNYDPLEVKYTGEDLEDAYQDGCRYAESIEALEQENRSLRSLLGANVRVMKEEIRKELLEENKKENP